MSGWPRAACLDWNSTMPTILEETKISLERVDLRQRSPIARPVTKRGHLAEPSRFSGIHLSGILRYIALESGLMRALADLDEEEMPLRMALGLAWEEFAVSLYPEIDWQPGELIEQGIAMTCDGISSMWSPLPAPAPCLEEFKLTWKKIRNGADFLDEWYWMHQGRGYLWGYGFTLCRWHVCFVNGDYRGSGPIYMRYLVQFSDEEIAKTGKMLLANKERAVNKGYAEK
jgi:hypothetical protein